MTHTNQWPRGACWLEISRFYFSVMETAASTVFFKSVCPVRIFLMFKIDGGFEKQQMQHNLRFLKKMIPNVLNNNRMVWNASMHYKSSAINFATKNLVT